MPQTLMLADDLMPAVRQGRKTCTVRTGHRPGVPGPMGFRPTGGRETPVAVVVRAVRHTVPGDLTDADLRGEGLRGRADLPRFVADMRRFYPGVVLEIPVTVVAFSLSDNR